MQIKAYRGIKVQVYIHCSDWFNVKDFTDFGSICYESVGLRCSAIIKDDLNKVIFVYWCTKILKDRQ